MRPGCGALLLTSLFAGGVLPGVVGAQVKKPELRHLPQAVYTAVPAAPAIECDVSAANVSPGQSVEVTTRVVQGNASGLKYSFESNGGRLTVAGSNASSARLDTTGVSSGEINVTCVVVDPYGRRVAYGKAIRLGTPNFKEKLLPTVKHAAPPPATVHAPAPLPEEAHVTISPPPPPPPAPKPVPTPEPGATAQPVEVAKPPVPVGVNPGGQGTPTAVPPVEAKSAGDTGSNEYAEGLAIQKWEKELKTGKIDYNLPTKMSLPDATTVSVVVHGYEDVSGPVPTGTQAAPLKVSQRMRVELSAEDPNEFKIEPIGTTDVQLIPIDGAARWQWKVTPKEPSANEKLTIRALLVYPNDPNKAAVEITSYTAEVSVQVGSLWEWTKYLFWNDPVGLLKYLLPGGAGFAFVAGLVAWWWKRRHPEKKDKE